jgi:hypothetical protein
MERTKLTIRLPRDLLEGAKRYAKAHNTTLTRLVSTYLQQLRIQDDPLADAPIVRRLSGTLSPDVSIDDYTTYLEEKYGGKAERSDWPMLKPVESRPGLPPIVSRRFSTSWLRTAPPIRRVL